MPLGRVVSDRPGRIPPRGGPGRFADPSRLCGHRAVTKLPPPPFTVYQAALDMVRRYVTGPALALVGAREARAWRTGETEWAGHLAAMAPEEMEDIYPVVDPGAPSRQDRSRLLILRFMEARRQA